MPDLMNFGAFQPKAATSADIFGNVARGADWMQALKNARQQELLGREQTYREHENAAMTRPLAEALIGLHGAQSAEAMHAANNPYSYLASLSGAAREGAGLQKVGEEYGFNSKAYKNAERLFNANVGNMEQLSSHRQYLENAGAFKAMPAAEKSRAISTLVGMGMDPVEATNYVMGGSGNTLQAEAQRRHVDLSNVNPNYPLQGEQVKQIGNRTANVAELESLEDQTARLNPYGAKVFGYYPEQIKDAFISKFPGISNDKLDEKLAGFYAERALSPEIAALRLKITNGTAGIESIHEMQNAVMSRSSVYESLMTAHQRELMNKKVNQMIRNATKVYTGSLYNRTALPASNTGIPMQSTKNAQVVAPDADSAHLDYTMKKYGITDPNVILNMMRNRRNG